LSMRRMPSLGALSYVLVGSSESTFSTR
jgi:hypothetical protein